MLESLKLLFELLGSLIGAGEVVALQFGERSRALSEHNREKVLDGMD
jgi:hypothetical protein